MAHPITLEDFRLRPLLEPDLGFVTSAAVGFPVAIYQLTEDGRDAYQVMRWDESPGPGKEFWDWHCIHRPQFFATAAAASAAFVQSWADWRRRPGPLHPVDATREPKTMNDPAKPAPRQHYSCDLARSVALAAPAVRFVVVSVSCGEDGRAESYTDPVTAVRSTVVDVYRADGREPRRAPSHREMIAEGWRYDGREVRDELLVHTDDLGLSDLDCAFGGMATLCFRVVPCPWPPGEDEERLAPVVAELSAEARAKAAKFYASRQQSRSATT